MWQIKNEIKRIINGKMYVAAMLAPLIVALVFGAVFSNNQIFDAKIAVVDLDNSNYSRQLIEKLDASPSIQVSRVFNEPVEPIRILYNEKYLSVLSLPQGLEENVYRGKQSNLGLAIDDTLAAATGNMRQAVAEVIATENLSASLSKVKTLGLTGEQAAGLLSGLTLQQRLLFNPTAEYINSIVFGFVHVVLFALLVLQTAKIIPVLRQEGSLRRALDSPAGLLSRLLPYSILFSASSLLSVGMLKQVGGLRFAGSVVEFLLPLFIFSFTSALLGMLLGWSAMEPSKAIGRIIYVVTPSFMLSNMTLPVALMPRIIQILANVFPMNWYFRFFKAIGLKGAPLSCLWSEIGGAVILTAVLGLLFIVFVLKELRKDTKLIDEAQKNPQIAALV